MSWNNQYYFNPEDCIVAGTNWATTGREIPSLAQETTDVVFWQPTIINPLPSGGGTYSYGWRLRYRVEPNDTVTNDYAFIPFGKEITGLTAGETYLLNLCYGIVNISGFFTGTPTELYIGQVYMPNPGNLNSYTLVIGGVTDSGDAASYYKVPASLLTINPAWHVVFTFLNGASTSNPSGIFNIADQVIGDVTIIDNDFSGTPTYGLLNFTAPCFLEGSQILCLVDEKETYLPIEKMRKGTLVKTLNSGYKMVHIIGKRDIPNFNDSNRIKDRLYKLTSSQYPALTSDLYLTGCHSTLVDSLTEEQRNEIKKLLGVVCVTEGKYRLPACVDQKAEPWQSNGTYTVWHFALDDQDPLINFGVYANGGLIVETGSIRYLQGKANMELV